MVNPYKDGSVSEKVTVRNNLATDFDLAGNSIVDDHNTVLDALDVYFVDAAGFDLHLLPNAPAASVEPVDGGASGGSAGTAGIGAGGSAAGGSGPGGSSSGGGAQGGSAQGGSASGTGGAKASGGSGVALDDSGSGCKVAQARASVSLFLLLASFVAFALRRRGARLSAYRRARAR